MTESNTSISEILMKAEKSEPAFVYSKEMLKMNSDGKDIFVISDLHISEGKDQNGNYSGTENFFFDDSFERFIDNKLMQLNAEGGTLIINGDFMDFLRVTKYPGSENDFICWQRELLKLAVNKTIGELKSSISDKEKKYGLKTNDYKTIWKFFLVVNGHNKIFSSLAKWVSSGNRLIIVKGNHDLEWIWPLVRNYLRVVLSELIAITGTKPIELCFKEILPKIFFVDDSLLIDENIFIEHGHRYDRYCKTVGDDLINNNAELNIPFGSFFNRYLINRIELAFPFIDNVRPREDLLPLLFRERFFLGLRVLFQHIPFLFLIIPKRYYKYMFSRVFVFLLAILIPLVFVTIGLWNTLEPLIVGAYSTGPSPKNIGEIILSQSKKLLVDLLPLVFSFAFARIAAYFQLNEPDSLNEPGRKKLIDFSDYKIVAFGHTHTPEKFNIDGRWFYNTGTWIPIVETSSASIREDKTFTFLHIRTGKDESIQSSLLRWNDNAGRDEDLILIESKE